MAAIGYRSWSKNIFSRNYFAAILTTLVHTVGAKFLSRNIACRKNNPIYSAPIANYREFNYRLRCKRQCQKQKYYHFTESDNVQYFTNLLEIVKYNIWDIRIEKKMTPFFLDGCELLHKTSVSSDDWPSNLGRHF